MSEIVHETPVFYYYTKNKGSHEENMMRKSSNNAPKINNGYCRLDIKVVLKTDDTGESVYDITYQWGFKPRGEWGDVNYITNGGNLLTWEEVLDMEQKLIDCKKSSPVLAKLQKLKALCPFHDDEEFIENNMNGETVKKNAMTTEIVNAVSMTNNELEAISGNTTSYNYRTNVMYALTMLSV